MPLQSSVETASLTPTANVLVIEDDTQLARVMELTLHASGYATSVVNTGVEGLAVAVAERPDLIVLDLGLPDIDGLEVCRSLRTWSVQPIVVVSGEVDEQRKIDVLDAGANDYVTKPYSVPEFLARLRAALRNSALAGAAAANPSPGRIGRAEFGDLVIDAEAHLITLDSIPVELTRLEFVVLNLLAANVGGVVSHQAIARVIRPSGSVAGALGAVRVHITNVRRKLGEGPQRPRIVTVPKLGYRLVVPSLD